MDFAEAAITVERVGTAIIGGGIAGCAVAYYLAAEGETDILLLEADELGSGSTGGSFGGVRQQFSTPLEIELSRRGLEFWRSAESVVLIVLGVLLLAAFLLAERRAKEPILPLELFRNRIFSTSAAIGFIIGLALFGSVTYLPIFLQIVKGRSPTSSGLQLTPMMGGLLVTSIVSGRLISRFGRYKPFPVVGTAVMAVGEGNYGRLAQQRFYTTGNARIQLDPAVWEMPGAMPEIAPSPDFPANIDHDFLSRSSVLQAWGTYGVLWPVVHQQLGVDPDLGHGKLSVVPQVPAGQNRVAGSDIRLGGGAVDVSATVLGRTIRVEVTGRLSAALTLGAVLPMGAMVAAVPLAPWPR